MYINDGLDTVEVKNTLHEINILLEKTDEVRKQITQSYINEKKEIKPLVLVQFPKLK
jgi:type III restriction protein res subunit